MYMQQDYWFYDLFYSIVITKCFIHVAKWLNDLGLY